MHADNAELNELPGRVIGCAFIVINTFGAGFHTNASTNEIRADIVSTVQLYSAKARYKDIPVGEYA